MGYTLRIPIDEVAKLAKQWGPEKKGFLHEYGLTIVLGSLFLLSWLGQGIFQWLEEADVAKMHGEALTWSSFFPSFASATLENWQSEFLQLFSFIVFTSFLIHKGSPESRDGDDAMAAAINRLEKRLEKLVPGELDELEREEFGRHREAIDKARKVQRRPQEA